MLREITVIELSTILAAADGAANSRFNTLAFNDAVRDADLSEHVFFNADSSLLTIRNLNVTCEPDETVTLRRRNGGVLVTNFDLLIENVKSPKCNWLVAIEHHQNTLVFKNCSYKTLLVSGQRQGLSLIDSEGGKTTASQQHDQIHLKNSNISGALSIPHVVQQLQVADSNIYRITVTGNVSEFRPQFLYFNQSSHITNDAYLSYKFFRKAALDLQDRAQAHVFYVKELEEFRKNEDLDFGTKLLLWLNDCANKHGLSFIRPILWLIFFSLVCVISISVWELGSEYTLENISVVLGYAIDINPIHSFLESGYWKQPNGFGGISIAMDSIRRIGILVFSYLTITSALRFRFKS